MKHRLLTLAFATVISLATAAPAWAGFGTSPGRNTAGISTSPGRHAVADAEMDHGRHR